MIYHLMQMLQESMGPLRVFTFVNFRIAMAVFSAALICFALGPWMVRRLQALQIGQHIREEGPEHHQVKAFGVDLEIVHPAPLQQQLVTNRPLLFR